MLLYGLVQFFFSCVYFYDLWRQQQQRRLMPMRVSAEREPGKKKNNCLRVLFIRVSSYTAPKSPTSPALQSVLLSRCWLLGVEFGTGPEISLRKSQCNPKAKLHKSARVSRFPTGNFHPPRMKESQTPSAFHPLQICCFLNPILPNMHPMFVRSR